MVVRRAGTVRVDVEARTGDFNRGMDRAERGLGRFTSRLSPATIGVGALTAGITAGIGAFRQLAALNNELTLGAGIAGIAAQEYQALSRTFAAFGASADLPADVINDLSERLEDARQGTQSYADAFRALGIDMDAFASLDRVDRLFAFSEALRRVDADTAQLAANELAGDQGQRFLSVVRQLGDELPAAYENFEDLSFTDEQIASIREASIALERVGATAQLAGAGIVNFISNALDRLRELGQESARIAEQNARDVERLFGVSTVDLERQFQTGRFERRDPAGFDSETLENIRRQAEAAERASQANQVLGDSTEEVVVHFDRFNQSLTTLVATLETSTRFSSSSFTGFENELVNRARQDSERLLAGLEELPDVVDDTVESVDTFQVRTVALGGVINTVMSQAINQTQSWGDVLLSVLAQLLQASVSSGGIGGLFGRQFGGPVRAGQAYIVGEAGPELFVPSQSGNIVPNAGVEIVNNISVSGGADAVAIENALNVRDAQLIEQIQRFGSPANVAVRTARA